VGSLLQFFVDMLTDGHKGRYTNDARAMVDNALMPCALQTDKACASIAKRAKVLREARVP
jgi:hypothetical protein